MKKLSKILLLLVASIFISTAAFASFVDFGSSVFAPVDGMEMMIIQDVAGSEYDILFDSMGGPMTWTEGCGIGIVDDEIGHYLPPNFTQEALRVYFGFFGGMDNGVPIFDPVCVPISSVDITKLFMGEEGYMNVWCEDEVLQRFAFTGDDASGELQIPVCMWTDHLSFWAHNCDTCNDFAVGGVNPVPAPAAILLLSSGLIGLAGFRKFKK